MSWHASKKVASELERVRSLNGGVLRPADVVKSARAQSSPLHRHFEWNDTKAAAAHRLQQARELIRCTVTLVGEDRTPMRAYVSLGSDRAAGDSYREISAVVMVRDHYDELLAQSLREAVAWQNRYKRYDELRGIFREIKKATKAVAKRPKRAAAKAKTRAVA